MERRLPARLGTVPSANADAWDRYAATYQAAAQLPTDVAHYGPDMPTEADVKILGNLAGKRVLELGCGGAQASIAFAKQGATAIGVDCSAEQLAFARKFSEQEGVRVELHQGDLADLAFVRADSIDLVFSAWSLQYADDLSRVFRQVHRVLKVNAPFVFSVPHPAYATIDDSAEGPVTVTRPYFDRSPIERDAGGVTLVEQPYTFSDLYMGLVRSSYRVDFVAEPEPRAGGPRSLFWRDAARYIPRALIIRARKEGN